MTMFNDLFEIDNSNLEKTTNTGSSSGISLRQQNKMSFVDKFKIPYVDGLEWDKTVGYFEIERMGICGNLIRFKGDEYKRRLKSLVDLKACSKQEADWLINEVHEVQRFQDGICMKEKNHSGPCKKSPYIPKSVEGEVLKASWAHEGADKNPYCNRGAPRNCLTQFDDESAKQMKQTNKNTGCQEDNLNLGIVLSKGATKYMCGLSHLDMISIAFNFESAEKKFDSVPDDYKNIMDKKWKELKEFHYKNHMVIYNDNNKYQDPMAWYTPITIESFGGSRGFDAIEFGHVVPVSEEVWQTRPYNVLPLTRQTNLMQSNNSVRDTLIHFQKMGQGLTEKFGKILKK